MLKWISKKRNQKGFTLIELVVVIAILGILAAIAIPKLGASRETAKKATHNSNVRILKSAASMYIADHPEETTVSTTEMDTEIIKYLDSGEIPKVPKGLKIGEITYDGTQKYEISITDGDIKVTPDAID